MNANESGRLLRTITGMEPHQQITSLVDLRGFDGGSLDRSQQLQALLCAWQPLFDDLSDGAQVFLKPNLIPDRRGRSRVNRALLVELSRYLLDRGFRVSAGDSPALLPADNRQLYEIADMASLAELGVQVVSFEDEAPVGMPVGTRTYYLPRIVLEADLLINLPTLDVADSQMLQGALCNRFGLLPGFQKMSHYQRAPFAELFAGIVVDINSLLPLDLTILDMPQPNGLSVLVSSNDPVALDAVVASLAGMKIEHVPVIRQAADAGLGIAWPEGFELRNGLLDMMLPQIRRRRGSAVGRTLKPFVMNLAAPFVTAQPDIAAGRCDGCGDCLGACPTDALSFIDGRNVPQLRAARCVGCFACCGACHLDAIDIKQSGLYSRLPDSWRRFCVEQL